MMTTGDDVLLAVSDLRVGTDRTWLLRDISFELRRGECLCLVGESGAGKSLLAQAIMGNLPASLQARGQLVIGGRPSEAARQESRRPLWGRELAMLPQEPAQALSPLIRIENQLLEVYELVAGETRAQASRQAGQTLDQAGLGEAAQRFPWQISGGMAQRAAAWVALAGGASILLADEPTKGLDRVWCEQSIQWFKSLQAAGGCVVIITHDLRMARAMGGRLMVLKDGEIVEHGPTTVVLDQPQHPFTRELMGSDPATWQPLSRSAPGDTLLTATGLGKQFDGRMLFESLNLSMARGERVVVQGPSGVGKSTLGNVLLGLLHPDAGRVTRSASLAPQAFQKLYQDPVASFSPHQRLSVLLQDVCRLHRQPWESLLALLARLNIDPAMLARRPSGVSGGELQRIALARTLLLKPALLFADEPTSRLDPISQQEALHLLMEMVAETDAALLLVTHDEDVAAWAATRTLRFSENGLRI
ncbi:MAG: ATP-binding cassette domain-containing protein [Lautropia sp.]|nr:ATP-binding cassette domain-containing protein [Lautropia sp.]